MRNLMRNTFVVGAKLYEGETEIIDEYGNKTGSPAPQYGDYQTYTMMVSPSRGAASDELFGTLIDYDRTMSTADITCPIDEHSILWIDHPQDSPHNYIVVKKAVWKNSVSYAIKRVDVRA